MLPDLLVSFSGALALAQSDGHHLEHAAFDATAQIGMGLHPVHYHNPVGLPRKAVGENGKSVGSCSHLKRLDRRADFRAHARLGDSIVSQNLPLALGRSAPMTAHGGENEGARALRLEPAARDADNLLQAGNAAAADRHRDATSVKLIRAKPECGELNRNAALQIGNCWAARRLSLQDIEAG